MRFGPQLLVGLVLHATACTKAKPDPAHDTPASPPAAAAKPRQLDVRFTGCVEASIRTRTCELPTGGSELRVWVRGATAPVVKLREAAEPIAMEAHADGFFGVVQARPADGELTVEADGAETWRVTFVDLGKAELAGEVFKRLTDPDQDDPLAAYEDARQRLQAALPKLEGYERRQAQRLLMKVQLAGEHDDAVLETGLSVFEEALQLGDVAAAIHVVDLVAHLCHERGDEATLQWFLDVAQLHAKDVLDDERRAELHYYRGILAHSRGDFREALAQFELAQRDSDRLQLQPLGSLTASFRLTVLGILGRKEEQSRLVGAFLADAGTGAKGGCMKTIALANAAWGLLLATPPGTANPHAARLIAAAMEQFGPGGRCDVETNPGHRAERDDAAITHAVEALWRGDPDTAQRRIAVVDAKSVAPVQRAWMHYVRASISMARGDLAPARAELREAAAGVGNSHNLDPLLAWRIAVLTGRLERAAGDRRAAIAAFDEAEAEVDAAVLAVGLAQGREGLAAGLGRSASLAIETRLEIDDVAGAVEVARRARSREFRPIGRDGRVAALPVEARRRWRSQLGRYRALSESLGKDLQSAWKLPADERDRALEEHEATRTEMRAALDAAYAIVRSAPRDPGLRRPSPGEVWLLYTPVTSGWVGFAVTAEQTRSASFASDVVDADAAAQGQLLAPFADVISASERILALPSHGLMSVAFGDLPFAGGQLHDHAPVLYGVDLPARDRQDAPRARALVVGDPQTRGGLGRLPGAAKEADIVSKRLRAAGWEVALRVGEDAVHDTVAAELATVDLFHYAGHGVRGASSWEFTLPLVGEAALGVGDVLALRRPPRVVVLTGCDTGRSDASLRGGGIHLAAAFLLAGSDLVVAATEPVDDAVASAFGQALYDGAGASLRIEDVIEAQRAIGRHGATSGTVFRAWVP